jgi:restriction endonuclease Mrr
MIDREEQIVILYALHRCGGKGRKSRIIGFILRNDLMKRREDDLERRQTNETKLENDLAWAREDLKEQGCLSMPQYGFWQITQAGREKLLRFARAVYEKKLDELDDLSALLFDRLNTKLLAELRQLGQKAVDGKNT